MGGLVAVILAAGKGTRMKSALPKVLHEVGGKPMVQHVLDAARKAGCSRSVAIIGFGSEKVQTLLAGQAETVLQEEQLGTGHAVLQAQGLLNGHRGSVLVLCGDTPLVTEEMLQQLCEAHASAGAAATVLTAMMPDPTGYGRVIRNAAGDVVKIVEQKDANADELAVSEINTGMYCFDSASLFQALQQVDCQNQQGEYYLTDVIGILGGQGKRVWAYSTEDHEATLGINSRQQLAQAEKILRRRKVDELMVAGVTVMDPDSTFVDADVVVGADTELYPFTWLEGKTVIGNNCVIGPNSRLTDVQVGDGSTVHFTYAHECALAEGVTVGPYVHLRPHTQLQAGVKIGNFVEVKNSVVGPGSKLPHLSYIGDTDMGGGVNIGCGTITVNYDGKKKHRTTIEDEAFIGCNSNLVAPVTVGAGAYVAAGSTITKDIPASALGVARARQANIDGWAAKRK